MGRRDLVFLAVILGGTLALGTAISRSGDPGLSPDRDRDASTAKTNPRRDATVDRINALLHDSWKANQVEPSAAATDLAVIRRLSLAMTGTIPSLEQIRDLERIPHEQRIQAHREALLKNRRMADYLAERFARAFVGTEDGPFVLFRRRRFVAWLSDAILENRPYDALVREMISGQGLWTDHPATNFVSVTFHPEQGRPDPERLAARVSRAFLGTRIDCAQCHDHPFQEWKQEDFRGLAAFFGGVHTGLRGVVDGDFEYAPLDRKTLVASPVKPRAPFLPELCPTTGSPREQLASWVVNPNNPGLSRATVNRVWALLYGRPLVEPVDDLPAESELPPMLLALAADFASSGYDLHRLIRIMTDVDSLSRGMSREDSTGESPHQAEMVWASFPMTRLRPEQVAGALYQASSVRTLGPESPWLVRLISYTQRNDFVKRYGDMGEDEFNSRSGTIPQRLLLMNGDLVGEMIKPDLFNASSQIATMASRPERCVEAAYLAVLTRRPSPEEMRHFASRLEGTTGDDRKTRLTDLFWTLLNSTEFSWNH